MSKHHLTVRYKGVCECGMKRHSAANLIRHAAARGHEILRMPKKASFKPGG